MLMFNYSLVFNFITKNDVFRALGMAKR